MEQKFYKKLILTECVIFGFIDSSKQTDMKIYLKTL